MLRTELIDKLDRVKPALSSNNLVPVLSHFWFRNNELLTYNDQIAISTKLKSSFEGAIPDTIVSLLTVSRAKEVEFMPNASIHELMVKAASSKFKLPYLEVKTTEIFKMPEADPKKALPVDMTAFIAAIDSCMRSLREDTSMPDSMGITLSFESEVVNMYATNDSTISHAQVKLKKVVFPVHRLVISGNFCRQMLALSKLDGPKHLEINDDYSLFQSGDTVLFGRLVDVQRPLDFKSVIESSFPKAAHKNLVSIPSKLELILERAVVITESKTERPKTEIIVEDGIAKFFSRSDEKGEVRDSCQLEGHHPNVTISIDPRLFRNGWGFFDKMLFTSNCLIMSKGNSLYLVSASH